jgi:glutaredoxin
VAPDEPKFTSKIEKFAPSFAGGFTLPAELGQPNPWMLLSRTYCHLCDDMLDALRRIGIEPIIVDVDADPALEARWNEQVPVLLCHGELVCFHRLDHAAVQAHWAKIEG